MLSDFLWEPNNPVYYKAKSIYDFRVTDLAGNHVKLDIYEGCVCIIVNTATKSNFTNMYYKQLNDLLDDYGESQGLRILAFPCNQFENEEPCTSAGIAAHAIDHHVKFDVFAKVNVNCNNAIPLYKFLKKCLGGRKLGDMIKSNYTKFVINRKGIPVERCEVNVFPDDMRKILLKYLKQRGPKIEHSLMSRIHLRSIEEREFLEQMRAHRQSQAGSHHHSHRHSHVHTHKSLHEHSHDAPHEHSHKSVHDRSAVSETTKSKSQRDVEIEPKSSSESLA